MNVSPQLWRFLATLYCCYATTKAMRLSKIFGLLTFPVFRHWTIFDGRKLYVLSTVETIAKPKYTGKFGLNKYTAKGSIFSQKCTEVWNSYRNAQPQLQQQQQQQLFYTICKKENCTLDPLLSTNSYKWKYWKQSREIWKWILNSSMFVMTENFTTMLEWWFAMVCEACDITHLFQDLN